MLVGQGLIKINGMDSMEAIVKKLYSLTSSSRQYIQQRVDRLKSIESHGTNLLQDYKVNVEDLLESDTESDRLINRIKKDRMIKSVMETTSLIADYTDKVICIIYLIGQKYHIKFKDRFRLSHIETEYEYINTDNDYINECIKKIQDDLVVVTDKLTQLKKNYYATTLEEIVDILDEYSDEELLSIDTGRIYRKIYRRLGEKFTKQYKDDLARFLSTSKSIRKKETKLNIPYLCKLFKIDSEQYETRKYSAIEPIVQLSVLDLLVK